MNNIAAAKVLMSHLPEIADGAYKTATEIAIESLLLDAVDDWFEYYNGELSILEYLGITQEQYEYWVIGNKEIFPTPELISTMEKYKKKLDYLK